MAVATFGFTSANVNTGGGNAGQASSSITGYTVGAPTYVLLASDPSKVASFSFTISTVVAGTTVRASLVPGTWISCSLGAIVGGSATATCAYAGGSEPDVSAATTFNVSAAN